MHIWLHFPNFGRVFPTKSGLDAWVADRESVAGLNFVKIEECKWD